MISNQRAIIGNLIEVEMADGITHQSTGAAREAAQPGDFRRTAPLIGIATT